MFSVYITVFEILNDLLMNSPNFNNVKRTTIVDASFLFDVMLWLDGCSPMVALKLRLYDHYLVFFPEGASKPLDLLTYIGTEQGVHEVLNQHYLFVCIIVRKILYIMYANVFGSFMSAWSIYM